MTINPHPYVWLTPPRSYYRSRVRKHKQIQIRARRSILEMREREGVFKPGPYRDAHGNARFLGMAMQ